jgi:hypothetical protein
MQLSNYHVDGPNFVPLIASIFLSLKIAFFQDDRPQKTEKGPNFFGPPKIKWQYDPNTINLFK